MSCQPFYLKSIKIEHEYKEAQNIFHKNKVVHLHKHADNNSIKHEFFEEITINPTEKQANCTSYQKKWSWVENLPNALIFKAGTPYFYRYVE